MNTTDSAKVSDANAGANNVIHIPHNPTLTGLATLTRNVAYKTGADNLVMYIISPQSTGDDDDRRYPTVVFVQGSAWTTPHRDYEIPQLSALAREGFVVATVNHRDASSDPHDAAIRYLRANARQWHVDPDRLGIWGTSSGGNTSLLVGLTADDPRYEDGTNVDESDAVKYVVSCFPPTDMMEAIDAFGNEDDPFRLYYFGPFAAVVGATHETGLSDDVRRRAADMSPYLQVRDGVAYPPTMLLHGTADTVVPYRQSVKMHKRLLEHGVDSRLVLVDGAEHEHDFWSPQVFDMIFDFIRERC